MHIVEQQAVTTTSSRDETCGSSEVSRCPVVTDIHVGCGGEWQIHEAHVDDDGVDLVLRCAACDDVLLVPASSGRDRAT